MNVFFCERKSTYRALNCETYDRARNALTCPDKTPAIYHPPCQPWGRLRKFAKWRPGEKWSGVWAIIRCRKFGGIVEHPESSLLFKKMGCPLPGKAPDKFGGITIQIDQVEFGHVCRKRTWLYCVGLPANYHIIITQPNRKPSRIIGSSSGKSTLKSASKKYRNYTPIDLGKELLRLCSLIEIKY